MMQDLLVFAPSASTFETPQVLADRMVAAAGPDAWVGDIGRSEQGRPLTGARIGSGRRRVTLVAGAHADEPVGAQTLCVLFEGLARGAAPHLLEQFEFRLVPHVNPDGAARNDWITDWPDLGAYLARRDREPPGRDVEFGYPSMRVENRAVSAFLFDYAPIALHASLHGMAFSEGALLLVERRWTDRVDELKQGFIAAVNAAGLPLHDQDRGGDKGFAYLGPGFWTTPEGTAMCDHFLGLGDDEMARKFWLSSMELAVVAGRDPETGETPLCLVTELPLFLIAKDYPREAGRADLFDRLRERLPEMQSRAREGAGLHETIAEFGLEPLSLDTAIRLQLRVIELGLEAIS